MSHGALQLGKICTSAGVSKVPSHLLVVLLGSLISAAHLPHGLCMPQQDESALIFVLLAMWPRFAQQ